MTHLHNNGNTLLTIKATNDIAQEALGIASNNRYLVTRYVTGSEEPDSDEQSIIDDGTPSPSITERFLFITLDTHPREPLVGWKLGSNAVDCDVLFDTGRRNAVSGVCFTLCMDHRTQELSIIAGKRGLKYKKSGCDRYFVLVKGATLAWRPEYSYTIYPGLLRFELGLVNRTEEETRRFNRNFQRYVAQVNPGLPAQLLLDDNQDPGSAAVETARILVLRAQSRRTYRMIDQGLGIGGSAVLKRATCEDDDKLYAVKILAPWHCPRIAVLSVNGTADVRPNWVKMVEKPRPRLTHI